MKCFNGIELPNGLVPCGQCMNCRINFGRTWSARLLMEWITNFQDGDNRNTWFVTLTYDDLYLPQTASYHPTLDKKAAQKWIKAVIRKLGKFRYYLVGEYGDLSGRPHYHMAVFLPKYLPISDITDEWEFGYTQSAEFTPERARYLAQYTTKKLSAAFTAEKRGEGVEREFRCSTYRPALGVPFVEQFLIPPYLCTTAGKEHLARYGDVGRTVKLYGKTYPIAPLLLRKMRVACGIPVKHEDRLNHDGYYSTWANEDLAERNPIWHREFQRRGQERGKKKGIPQINRI